MYPSLAPLSSCFQQIHHWGTPVRNQWTLMGGHKGSGSGGGAPPEPFTPASEQGPGLGASCPAPQQPPRSSAQVSANSLGARFPPPQLIPINMFLLMQFALTSSSVKRSSCQANMKDIKQAPWWQLGEEAPCLRAPAHCRGQAIPPAHGTQMRHTHDWEQTTQGQRAKSHLYNLLLRISLHYFRENVFFSRLHSFCFLQGSCWWKS